MGKPAWIKSTLAWKAGQNDPHTRWRTVNFLMASERIAAGRNLNDSGTYEELVSFLLYLRNTAPDRHNVAVVDCPTLHQPTVRWQSIDSPYSEGHKITGDHDLEPLAKQLWERLGKYLERCEFDFWEPSYYQLDGDELISENDVQSGP